MAVKTFLSGEILTAADTNTYLNNGGLVYIKSQTIGSAVSTVTVSNAFSASYENYKIIISGGVGSTNLDLRLQLGSATTNYYTGIIGTAWAAGTAAAAARNNTVAYMDWVGAATTSSINMNFDLIAPYLSKNTHGAGQFLPYNAAYYSGSLLADSTSYTAFTLSTSTGTLTGGTIIVYGYRQA